MSFWIICMFWGLISSSRITESYWWCILSFFAGWEAVTLTVLRDCSWLDSEDHIMVLGIKLGFGCILVSTLSLGLYLLLFLGFKKVSMFWNNIPAPLNETLFLCHISTSTFYFQTFGCRDYFWCYEILYIVFDLHFCDNHRCIIFHMPVGYLYISLKEMFIFSHQFFLGLLLLLFNLENALHSLGINSLMLMCI